MFKILDEISPTYTWPVTACVAANRGKVTQIKFVAEFRRLDDERVQELNDQTNDTRPKTDKTLLAEVLESVGEEADGQYTAGSASEQARLLNTVGVRKAVALAYYRSLSGEKAKN